MIRGGGGGGGGSLEAKVIEWQTKLVELSTAKDKVERERERERARAREREGGREREGERETIPHRSVTRKPPAGTTQPPHGEGVHDSSRHTRVPLYPPHPPL